MMRFEIAENQKPNSSTNTLTTLSLQHNSNGVWLCCSNPDIDGGETYCLVNLQCTGQLFLSPAVPVEFGFQLDSQNRIKIERSR